MSTLLSVSVAMLAGLLMTRIAKRLKLPAVTADRTFALTCDEYQISLSFAETDTPQNTYGDKAIQDAVFGSLEVYAGGSWRKLSNLAAGGGTFTTTYSELESAAGDDGVNTGIKLRSQRYPRGAFYGADGFMKTETESPQVHQDTMSDLHEYLFPLSYPYATEYAITVDKTCLVINTWNVIADGSVWQSKSEDEDAQWYFKPQSSGTVANFSFALNNLDDTPLNLEKVKVFVYDEELKATKDTYTITKAPCEYEGWTDDEEYRLTLQGLDEVRGDKLTKIALENDNPNAALGSRTEQGVNSYYRDENAFYYPTGTDTTTLEVEYTFKHVSPEEIADFTAKGVADAIQALIKFKASIEYTLPSSAEPTVESFDLSRVLPGMTDVKQSQAPNDGFKGEYTVTQAESSQLQVRYTIDRGAQSWIGDVLDYTKYIFRIYFTFAPAVDMTATISE